MREFGNQFSAGGMDMGGGMPMMNDQMVPPEIMMQVQQVVDQYGISPEQAMELVMSQQPQDPMATAQGQLGQMPPQLSQADYLALAQQFGMDPSAFGGDDPAYNEDYDIANVLSGAYGYES